MPTSSLLTDILPRDDWSKFTDYRGYDKEDQVISWFWQILRSWPAEQKARLLQFTTGTSRIPVNGFKDLQGSDGPRRFTIEKYGDSSKLPRSHTCFNRLDLPPYEDIKTLEDKLRLAIEYVSLVFIIRTLPDVHVGKQKDSGKSKWGLGAFTLIAKIVLSPSYTRAVLLSLLFPIWVSGCHEFPPPSLLH